MWRLWSGMKKGACPASFGACATAVSNIATPAFGSEEELDEPVAVAAAPVAALGTSAGGEGEGVYAAPAVVGVEPSGVEDAWSLVDQSEVGS